MANGAVRVTPGGDQLYIHDQDVLLCDVKAR